MEKIKVGIFIVLVGYMVLGTIVSIPPIVNNFLYGAMAILALLFVFTNKEKMGLTDIFKKKEDDKFEKE
jgi:hypothetical protein